MDHVLHLILTLLYLLLNLVHKGHSEPPNLWTIHLDIDVQILGKEIVGGRRGTDNARDRQKGRGIGYRVWSETAHLFLNLK